MAKNIRGKRPCCICRKWFQPIAQQKGGQKTCSPACQQELHRRQCEQWNRKNKAYFKSNYLADKIDAIEQQEQSKDPPADQPAQPKNPSFFFYRSRVRRNRFCQWILLWLIWGKNTQSLSNIWFFRSLAMFVSGHPFFHNILPDFSRLINESV